MKIVILNTSERTGGAAVAAGRLAKALRKTGLQVNQLYREDNWKNRLRFYWERLIIFLCNHFSRKNLFTVSIANTGVNLSHHPLVQEADIIHLHWINQGFLSLKDIEALTKLGKPIVWTMHDMWPATAICHYPDQCVKYREECNNCPVQTRFSFNDLASVIYKKKKRIELNKICFVGCSQWITNMAKQSSLLKDALFTSIPNPIDNSVYKPQTKQEARSIFKFNKDKILILFAAAKLSDKRKGVNYFIEACTNLKQEYSKKIEIVLIGNASDELCYSFPFKVNVLGYISDYYKMIVAYSCVDIFVVPSLEDNLPNTIMESMACGTPCVGFATGGIPEMIDHKKNGYIANYKDAEDLANGIRWVLAHKNPQELSKACIEKIQKCYTEDIVARQYIKLYESLLKKD